MGAYVAFLYGSGLNCFRFLTHEVKDRRKVRFTPHETSWLGFDGRFGLSKWKMRAKKWHQYDCIQDNSDTSANTIDFEIIQRKINARIHDWRSG